MRTINNHLTDNENNIVKPENLDESVYLDMESDDKKKKIFNTRIKPLLMFLLALAVLTFVGIAWFTMNRNSHSEGMNVRIAEMPFDIATYGTSGVRYEEQLSEIAPEYTSGTVVSIDERDYYVTGGSTDSIRLRYSTGESEIGPGGCGKLELYVIPKNDGALSVNVKLDLLCYVEADMYEFDENNQKIQALDENNDPIYEEDGVTPVYRTTKQLVEVGQLDSSKCTMDSTEIASRVAAADYLKGHVMFFGGLGDTSNPDDNDNYYYTSPKTEREVNYTRATVSAGEAYEIPIYWMWPNTLGQIALDGNNGYRDGIPIVRDGNTAQKALLVSYLQTNKTTVFKNAPGVTITDEMISNASVKANFEILSDGYNNADFDIGSKIDYFMIEVVVENGE